MEAITVAEAQLTRVLSFFPRIDAKITGLFAINSAILTVGSLNVRAADIGSWYVSLPAIAMLLLLTGSYHQLYQANYPQLDGGEDSLVYFHTIQKRTELKFVAEFEACDENSYRRDLLGQVWRNSQILAQKYASVRRAIRLTLAALVPFTAVLVSGAIIHAAMPEVK